jgi:hypothetical protein
VSQAVIAVIDAELAQLQQQTGNVRFNDFPDSPGGNDRAARGQPGASRQRDLSANG